MRNPRGIKLLAKTPDPNTRQPVQSPDILLFNLNSMDGIRGRVGTRCENYHDKLLTLCDMGFSGFLDLGTTWRL